MTNDTRKPREKVTTGAFTTPNDVDRFFARYAESPSDPAPVVNRGEEKQIKSTLVTRVIWETIMEATAHTGLKQKFREDLVQRTQESVTWAINQESPLSTPAKNREGEKEIIHLLLESLKQIKHYGQGLKDTATDPRVIAEYALKEYAASMLDRNNDEARVSLLASDERPKSLNCPACGCESVSLGELCDYDKLQNDRLQELEKELAELRDLIYAEDGYIESQKSLMKENATLRENREFWRLKAMEADGKFAELRERLRKYEEGK